MSGARPSDKLESFLRDSLLQWLLMRPNQEDARRDPLRRHTLYAVDANVVAHWANPSAPKDVGNIFRQDEPEMRLAISQRLASYIFDRIPSVVSPLLVISPIHLEIQSILFALLEKRETDLSKRDDDREIEREIDRRLKDSLVRLDSDFAPDELRQLAPKLRSLIFQRIGPAAAARRIQAKIGGGSVVLLSKFPIKDRAAEFQQVMTLTESEKWTEAKESTGYYGWRKRLEKIGSWRTRELLDHDAEVLAKLETWNSDLISKGSSARVLYITNDRRIIRAGSEYLPTWHPSWDFARICLRHSHAFLDEPGVLDKASPGTDRNRVGEFFQLARDRISVELSELLDPSKREVISERVHNEVAKLSERHGKPFGEALVNGWTDFVRNAVAMNPTPSADLVGLSTLQRAGAKSLNDAIRHIDAEISRHHRKTLDAYLRTLTGFNTILEFRSRKETQHRVVEPIYFERWRRADNFIATVSGWGPKTFDRREYDNGVEALRAEDPTEYSYYLAHAALFAGRNRWLAAALFAERALDLARSLSATSRNGANGREANYFAAVCQRHAIRSEDDLTLCRELLQRARDVLIDEGNLKVVPERFEAEELAIRFVSLMLRRFSDTDPLSSEQIDLLNPDHEDISLAYEDLRKRVEDTLDLEYACGGLDPDADRRAKLLGNLRIRLLMNTIALGLIPFAPNIAEEKAYEAWRQLEGKLAEQRDVKASPGLPISGLGIFTLECARLHYDQVIPEFAERQRATLSLLQEQKKKNIVFPFDRARFDGMWEAASARWTPGGSTETAL